MRSGIIASTRPPKKVLVSDSFSGSNGAMNGRYTDNAFGGVTKQWSSPSNHRIISSQFGANTNAMSASYLPASHQNVELSVKVATVNVCTIAMLLPYASSPYDVEYGIGIEIYSGVAGVLYSGGNGYASTQPIAIESNDIVTLRRVNSNISFLINGVVQDSTVDPYPFEGNYIGIATKSNSVRLDDLILTEI